MNSEQLIADRLFDLLEGSVLELGPHSGQWFTQHIVKHSDCVTAIELDAIAVQTLRQNFPQITVQQADYHTAVQGVGYHDNVVAFGVLTHTHSPLGLIEDICNYIKPRRIFIEAEPGGIVRCVREGVNQPGQRQARRLTSRLSIQLGTKIYKDALENLGYDQIAQWPCPEGDRRGREYSVYQLRA